MNKIVIIPYNINKESLMDFAMVGLRLVNNELDLFSIDVKDLGIKYEDFSEDIRKLSMDFLLNILIGYTVNNISLEEEIQEGDTMYLFYNININNLNSVYLGSTKTWFSTMHEVLNTWNVCSTPITNAARTVISHMKRFFAVYSDDAMVEAPTVLYTSACKKKTEFESLFGKSREDNEDGLGNNYHFYEYDKCKGEGIVRYAVFLGKCDINPTNVEKWEENYDSLFFAKDQHICVSKYSYFYPLSYHYVN